MADHYAVLGLAPYAEHSAVRAAYLALMRRYHPDINASAEAAARAREVTAAYEVLGDPDSRTDYDLARAHAHAVIADARSPGLGSPRALAALASVAGVAALMLLVGFPSTPNERAEPAAKVSARSTPPQPAPQAPAPAPARPQAKPADAVVPPAPVEVARAPAPVEARPAPPAPVEVKRPPAPVEVKRAPPPVITAAPSPRIAPPRTPPRIAPQRAAARDKPSSAAALAGLDRHLGMLLRQSVQRADAAKQKSLYRDHYRFVARLNGCSTEACKQREYLARMGEISATMAAPAKPR